MNCKFYIIAFCCLVYATMPIQAQRGRGKSRARAKVQVITPDDINALLNAYRFEEASDAIETAIETATRKKMDTSVFEEQDRVALIGKNMLQSTQKVTFIDSVVVDKNNFLNALNLNGSCGAICKYEDVFDTKNTSEKLPESTVFINEFKDRLIYAAPDKNGFCKLYERIKLGAKWSNANILQGIGDSTDVMGYPFVLSDGTTLYFAAKDANSLGGYDIYVTRFNPDTEQYVKAENIGMPFNSPANDYLYALDETNNLGWFVTDRLQPEDKVCIYTFVPTESRTNYNSEELPDSTLRSLAQLRCIKESQTDKNAVAEALKRLQDLNNDAKATEAVPKGDFRFYLANGVAYNSTDAFKSAKAQQLAQQWLSTTTQRKKLIESLKNNRLEWKKQSSSNLKNTILKQERDLEQLDAAVKALENNIRKEEAAALK